jgi:hypothetical protein
VLHSQDTLPCVCSLSAMTQAAAADQGSGIFRPAARLRPPSTPLQQHVRCEMVIFRIPPGISGPLLPWDLREAVSLHTVTQWPSVHNHTSIDSLGGAAWVCLTMQLVHSRWCFNGTCFGAVHARIDGALRANFRANFEVRGQHSLGAMMTLEFLFLLNAMRPCC